MIDEKAYKKIRQYAKALCNDNDWEDIANETCILFLEYPSFEDLSNKFWMTLVRRAKYRFYFDTNSKELKYKDAVLENYEELIVTIPEENNFENVYYLFEYKKKLRQVSRSYFIKKENELFDRILDDVDTTYADRGNYHNLKNKLRRLM